LGKTHKALKTPIKSEEGLVYTNKTQKVKGRTVFCKNLRPADPVTIWHESYTNSIKKMNAKLLLGSSLESCFWKL